MLNCRAILRKPPLQLEDGTFPDRALQLACDRKGFAGVPPDLMATLLFGPDSASGLEWRHADILLGKVRGVMDALFPGAQADLLLY